MSGSTAPSSALHGHSQDKDRTRHSIQGNTPSTSLGFPHGDSEGFSIACLFCFVICEVFSVQPNYPPSPKLL